MKKIVFLILLLPVFAFSQRFNKKDIVTTDLDSVEYSLMSKTLAPSDIHLPFKRIEILDARFDTSKLGFEMHREYAILREQDFKRIKLTGGIENALTSFYNDYYKLCFKDSTDKLLIVLKTLWIDNFPSADITDGLRYDVTRESYQNVHIKFEYYFVQNNFFFPVKRIDTVYQLTEDIMHSPECKFKRNDLSFFTYAMKSLIEKYDFHELKNGLRNKRRLNFENIDSFNRKRFVLPILTASTINKGMYLNYKEFINNAPSVEDYEFKKNHKEEFWVNKKNDEKIPRWYAISDSLGMHVGALKRIKIIRVENTYESFKLNHIYLPKTIAGNLLNMIPRGNPGYSGSNVIVNAGSGARLQYVLVPRQVNMETGEIY